jgi:hypothetical protein
VNDLPVFVPYAAALMGALILSGALAVLMKFTFLMKKGEDKSDRSLDAISTPLDMLKSLQHQIAVVQTLALGTPDHQASLQSLLVLLHHAKIHFPGQIPALSHLIAEFKAVPAGSDAFVAPLLQTHNWIKSQSPGS